MLGAEGEDFALDHGALDVVVLQHHVLLEAFDGKVGFGISQIGQHHLNILVTQNCILVCPMSFNSYHYLAKTAFAEDFDELEVVEFVFAVRWFRLDGRFAPGGSGGYSAVATVTATFYECYCY